jgi:tetratricopeptide (TPR) repeat protein
MKRKSLYQRLGGYEEVQNTADFVFLCKNSLKIRFMRVTEHSTYFYRLLLTSLSHKFEARNKITADILNEMVSIYPQEVLCPHIEHITEPALRRQQYYKYLMDTFYKHVHGHMVKFGEYFRRYGDYYKNKLLDSTTAVNSAASSVAASANTSDVLQIFKRGIDHLKADQPAQALDCFDEIYRSGGAVTDLQYARAVAFARLGRTTEARRACLEQLNLNANHDPAKELLEEISKCEKVTN